VKFERIESGAENWVKKENLASSFVLNFKLSFLGCVVGIGTQQQSWFSFKFLIFCVFFVFKTLFLSF